VSSRAALGGDGIVRGWVQNDQTPACADEPMIFFQGAGRSWTAERSPYQGRLLAAGYDGTGTYLLYQAADGVRITKRTAAGAFTAGRLLSTATTASEGAVFATGGTWWAVWNEPTGVYPDDFPVYSLFQAKTYGTDQARRRITFTDDDGGPVLARRPGGGAVLAWTRGYYWNPSYADVRVATSADGSWQSRAFATAGQHNQYPDLATDATHTYLTWTRDGLIVEADNTSGTFRSHTFNTHGSTSRVAVSSGRVFVAWSPPRGASTFVHVFVAERRAGSWSGLNLPRSTPGHELAAGVTAYGGKATVRFHGGDPGSWEVPILYARTQL
jgi:hypothetical protein